AQSALNLTLLGGLTFLNSKGEKVNPASLAFLTAGFGLTMLGHYGMMLGTLPILVFFALWTIISGVRRTPTGNATWLLGAGVTALAGSIVVYYAHFTTEIWAQWTGVVGKVLGQRSASTATGGSNYFQALLK